MHALFVYNSNPGAVAPNHNAVKRGLEREDLFTVVHELFFTDTTDYADYILPATTFLEHTDIQGAYGHYFVQMSKQAIDPVGESRSNVWLFGQLGQRMGFAEECFRDTPEDIIRQALAIGEDGHSANPEMEHITYEALEEQGHLPLGFHREPEVNPFLPYSSGNLPTPSGKVEFYSDALAAAGQDPAARVYSSNGVALGQSGGSISPGVAGTQGRQLHELHFCQSRRTSQDGIEY